MTMDKVDEHNPFEDEQAIVSDSEEEVGGGVATRPNITQNGNHSATSIKKELAAVPSIRDRIKQFGLAQSSSETSAGNTHHAVSKYTTNTSTTTTATATHTSALTDTVKTGKPSSNQVVATLTSHVTPSKSIGGTAIKDLTSAWEQKTLLAAEDTDNQRSTHNNSYSSSVNSSPLVAPYQLRLPPQSRTPSPSLPSNTIYMSTLPLRQHVLGELSTGVKNTTNGNGIAQYNPLAEPAARKTTRQSSEDNPFSDVHAALHAHQTNSDIDYQPHTATTSSVTTTIQVASPISNPTIGNVNQLRSTFMAEKESSSRSATSSISSSATYVASPQLSSKPYKQSNLLNVSNSAIDYSSSSISNSTTSTTPITTDTETVASFARPFSHSIADPVIPPALPQKPIIKRSSTYSATLPPTSKLSASPPSIDGLPNSIPPPLLPRPATRPILPSPTSVRSTPFTIHTTSSDSNIAITDAADVVTVALARNEQAGKISRIELNGYPQPDARFPSRRPPIFHDLESELKHIGPARCFAMCTRHVITAANALRVWDVVMGTPVSMASRGNEIRIDACCFVPPSLPSEESQWIWCALKTGELWEVEAETGVITEQRSGAHTCSVTHMLRARAHLWTLDESGRLQCWHQQGDTGRLSLKGQPSLRRVSAKVVAATVVASEQLWLSTGKTIEVYLPLARSNSQSKQNDNINDDYDTDHHQHQLTTLGSQTRVSYEVAGSISGLPITTLQVNTNVGDITCMSVDDSVRRVFTGHADGHVTIWCSKTYQRLQVYKASLYAITALASPGQQQHLWAAFQTGKICVYDTSRKPWTVIKDWQAHDKAIQAITVDNASLALLGRLQVASLDIEGCVRIWDGLLCDDFIDAHITLKQNEFCNYRDINILICSWNCDARKPKSLLSNSLNAQFLKEWLTASPVTPDIIVVGFQEIIDLESKKTTAKSLLKSKKKAQTEEASRRYGLWRSRLVVAVQEAYPNETYSLLKSEHLVGLFSCMFVRRTIYDSVAGVTASMVKTGFGGRYGNKGGIAMRLVINDSSICFANCHLAAGQKEVSQRNTDAAKVLRECELEPLASRPLAFVCGGDGLKMTDHEFCFFSGDLNYRIDLSRAQVESLISDRDWTQLMENDQLCQQRARNRQHPLRSFSELPLDFIPTYKYNRGEEVFDTSEKMRIPAWCDRILHRYGGRPGPILPDTVTDTNGIAATTTTTSTNSGTDITPRIQQMSYRRHECLVSDHRPISASFQISARHINKEKRSCVERAVADIHLANIRSQAQEAMADWLVNMGYAPTDAMNALRREHWDIHAAASFLQEARLRGF